MESVFLLLLSKHTGHRITSVGFHLVDKIVATCVEHPADTIWVKYCPLLEVIDKRMDVPKGSQHSRK